MINVNNLLRAVTPSKENYSHKDMSQLLLGVKGKFTKSDIKKIRTLINNELTKTVNILTKLENE